MTAFSQQSRMKRMNFKQHHWSKASNCDLRQTKLEQDLSKEREQKPWVKGRVWLVWLETKFTTSFSQRFKVLSPPKALSCIVKCQACSKFTFSPSITVAFEKLLKWKVHFIMQSSQFFLPFNSGYKHFIFFNRMLIIFLKWYIHAKHPLDAQSNTKKTQKRPCIINCMVMHVLINRMWDTKRPIFFLYKTWKHPFQNVQSLVQFGECC